MFQPSLALAMGASALVALGLPLLLAYLWWRRSGAPLEVWLYGALVFFVSQILLRLPWQIPLAVWLGPQLKGHPAALVGFMAFSALGAGLFEEVGRYVGYRRLVKEHSWRAGVMYGLGHGGIESILLVGTSVAANLVLYWLLAHGWLDGVESLAAAKPAFAQATPGQALLGGVERISSMAVHVGASVLVLQAITRGQRTWLWAAVGFHALTDFVGPGSVKVVGPYGAEGVIGAFGVAALGITWALRTAQPASTRSTSLPSRT